MILSHDGIHDDVVQQVVIELAENGHNITFRKYASDSTEDEITSEQTFVMPKEVFGLFYNLQEAQLSAIVDADNAGKVFEFSTSMTVNETGNHYLVCLSGETAGDVKVSMTTFLPGVGKSPEQSFILPSEFFSAFFTMQQERKADLI